MLHGGAVEGAPKDLLSPEGHGGNADKSEAEEVSHRHGDVYNREHDNLDKEAHQELIGVEDLKGSEDLRAG